MDLEDHAMERWVNKDLARWFAQQASKEYGFYVRIVGSLLELHAEHHWTGKRYIARARRMEEAAPELLRMLREYPPMQDDSADTTKPTGPVKQAWRSAAKALGVLYAAIGG
jgi:hypothetical protein